ncbi:NUDIX hydrolase [Anatilimnocola sp. NA78]|uniref:NUDIX hydrolase n=1 Tax=Anatilimnocola sp. NA78 TaxID=3415683 RepID=UPI003CE57436
MNAIQRTCVAAYAVIVDGEKILLCRFSAEIEKLAGQRTLSGGGIDFGESPASGMSREVLEETGLVVRAVYVAHVDSFISQKEGATWHHVRIIYRAKVLTGELRHEVQGSTDGGKWSHKGGQLPLTDLAALGWRPAFT